MLTAEELLSLPLRPLQDDTHPTPTSIEESFVEDDIAKVMATFVLPQKHDALPLPVIELHRGSHVSFINKSLTAPLPASYVGYEGTRPWLLYWALHSLTLLAHPVDEVIKARTVSTLLSCQHPTLGGFGGGPGQIPHLMNTYAVINALAIAGGPGACPTVQDISLIQSHKATIISLGRGGWGDIDRVKMYQWLMRLKQPDGSFPVHEGGEVDVRASYCVWCIATLLGIGTQELFRGMAGFIASCQSYEGGLASASFPSYTPQLQFNIGSSRPALGESHGGYAFCATAAYLGLRLLDPLLYQQDATKGYDVTSIAMDSDPTTAFAPTSTAKGCRLNLSRLTRWTIGLQCPFPSQGGGFKGRINKLVDGCYSWFSGAGMWGALEALRSLESNPTQSTPESLADSEANDEDLWSRTALQLYILLVAQNLTENGEAAVSGGLRDKPGRKPDAYHTCYNLSGLSASQHVVRPCKETRTFCYTGWKSRHQKEGQSSPSPDPKREQEELLRRIFSSTLGYNLAPGREKIVVGERNNELLPTHPILNVGFLQVRSMMVWSYGQEDEKEEKED